MALVMALAAIILGYLAFTSGKKETQEAAVTPGGDAARVAEPAPPQFQYKAVIAVKPIAPDQPIPAEAVSLEPVTVMPEGGFEQVEAVVGKAPAAAIAVGEPVVERHFRRGGTLAQNVRPGERAVAVAVNDVIGVGGFVQPGDYVDVLLYLAQDSKQVQDSQAQVLLRRLRVLAYDVAASPGDDKGKPRTGARTAVLAVPEQEVSRLMLAASAGTLRLALHGAAEEPGEAAQAVAQQGVAYGALAAAVPAKASTYTLRQLAARAPEAPRARSRAAPQPATTVVIHHGTRIETVKN